MRGFLFVCAAVSTLAALPALAQTKTAMMAATLEGSDGKGAGSVMLTEAPKGVLIKISLKGLKPGWHGLHLHEKGDCGTPDFKSAGGHVHGAGTAVHGLLNPQANEAGDLPNVFVAADGTGEAEVFSPWTSLTGEGGRTKLLDDDGSALVVHASPDDHIAQPIGNAGGRVACAVLQSPANFFKKQ